MDKDANMDPPIHTEYLCSGGTIILIFIVGRAKAVISFCMRSAKPEQNNESIYRDPTAPKNVTRAAFNVSEQTG